MILKAQTGSHKLSLPAIVLVVSLSILSKVSTPQRADLQLKLLSGHLKWAVQKDSYLNCPAIDSLS